MKNMDKESLITFATALSALAVTQVGVGVTSESQLKTLQKEIQLQPVSSFTNK